MPTACSELKPRMDTNGHEGLKSLGLTGNGAGRGGAKADKSVVSGHLFVCIRVHSWFLD